MMETIQSVKKRWSPEEEKVLCELYSIKPTKELLEFLPGRTKDSVIKKAKLLGLNGENRHWSEEETVYLEEKWGVIPVENIAKKLGRTKNAVLLKAHKIGLRDQVIANGEYLTPKDISSILGVGAKTVYNWMDKGYLKYKRLKINSVKKYQITIANFKKFLESYQEKWDTRAADITFINACYVTCSDKVSNQGVEWLMNKVEMDKQKQRPLSRKQWTVKEEITLKSMINRGITCKEIAKLLNRSFYSVQGKITSKRHERLNYNTTISKTMAELNQVSGLI
jgi:transposase